MSSAPETSLYRRLRQLALRAPDAPALVFDAASHTRADLLRRIENTAARLHAAGVRPGQAVAVAFPNSLDFVVASFASFALHAVLVPLNPRFTAEELRHCLQLTSPSAILHPENMTALFAEVAAAGTLRWTSTETADGPGGDPLQGASAPTTTGLYLFSSGSTGKSKRVTRTQAQVLAEFDALAQCIALGESDRILCTIPLFHAHGFANAMMAALLSGAVLVIQGQEFNARATMQALQEQRISIYPAVPFMFKMLTETQFSGALDLSALRLTFSAGAPLAPAVGARFFELFSRPVCQLYGSTETGAVSINTEHPLDKPTSVGRALPGTRLIVKDAEGNVLGPGQVGEIWVQASSATTAYDGLPDLTRECFVQGAFFTGDLGQLDAQGDLFISGRKKLLINVAGYKVDPLEVEQALAQHPQVSDVVVIGVAHAGAGERIKAVVVLREPSACGEQELIAFAATRLADYKLPRSIEFRTELPRSPLGKIVREHLH